MMKGLKLRLKHFIFTMIGLFAAFVIMECFAYLLLRFVLSSEVIIDYHHAEKLVRLFPAQLRMNADEIRQTFPRAMPLQKTGNYISFPFDPVLGFRRDDALQWYGGSLNDLKSKFLIVTFGGSTTVKDSWPKYLGKYAQLEKVKQEIVVCNAGHWGYMTFLEKIYFTSWILPMLEGAGAKPDLVLTLDGVNDIWFRIMGYLESKRQKSPFWYSQYHAYHQHLDTDLRNFGQLNWLTAQAVSCIGRNLYTGAVRYVSPYAPYTLKMLLELSRRVVQRAPVPERIADIAGKNTIELDAEVEDRIIDAYKDSLIDFLGTAEVRQIKFVGYLQPVLLKKYYPYSLPSSFDYSDFNSFALRFWRQNRYFSRLGGDFIIRTENLYNKAEAMYDTLNLRYPGHFKNLTQIFKELPQTEQIYNKDAIHYEELGKETIAQAIIKDLIAKNILTR